MRKLEALTLTLLSGVVFLFFLRPVSGDGDFFHHINTGRYFLENFRLPNPDIWTFSANGRSWVPHGWGMGIIFFLIYGHFGNVGMSVTLASFALGTTLLLYLLLRLYGVNHTSSILSVLAALPLVSIRWPNRPEIVTYPFTILTLLLYKLKDRYPRLVLLYPILMILWTNTYGGSAFVGLLLIAVFILIEHRNYLLIGSGLAAFGASLLNPAGLSTVLYSVLYIPKISRFQGEWAGITDSLSKAPLEFVLTFQYRVVIYIIFVALLLLLILISRKTLLRYKFLTTLSFSLILPVFAFRLAGLAAILASPLFGLLLTHLKKSAKKIMYPVILASSFIAAALSVWIAPLGIAENQDADGPKLIRFLTEYDLKGKVLNNQEIGAYLSYSLYPNVTVFYDTRDDLFLDTHVLSDLLMPNNIRSVISLYKIDLVIVDFASGGQWYQPILYDPEWVPVFMSGRLLVVAPKKLASSKGLPRLWAIDPFSPSGAKPGLEQEALKEYLEVNETSFAAGLRVRLGQFDEVLRGERELDIGQGPAALLYKIQKYTLLTDAYIGKSDCVGAFPLVQKIQKLKKRKLIFSPSVDLPAPVINRFTTACPGLL